MLADNDLEISQQELASAVGKDARRCIKKLRSRFERWELPHLRELAASLQERLEEAERRAHNAERTAEWLQDMHDHLEEELRRSGKRLGLTTKGDLVLLPETSVRLICDDFGDLVEVAS